jgi:hypothetical protein
VAGRFKLIIFVHLMFPLYIETSGRSEGYIILLATGKEVPGWESTCIIVIIISLWSCTKILETEETLPLIFVAVDIPLDRLQMGRDRGNADSRRCSAPLQYKPENLPGNGVF